MEPILLDDWSVAETGDAYTPPELREQYLRGFSHARQHRVSTSPIRAASGRVVTTKSGTRYMLGTADQYYVAWLGRQGKTIDEAEPVKILPAANLPPEAPSKPKEIEMPAATDIEESKRFKRPLPVDLTEKEMAAIAKKTGKLKKKIAEIKNEMKAATSGYRDAIKETQAKLDGLLDDGESGTEERQVECFERKDWKRGKAEIIRTDTNEVIETRTISSEERQATMAAVEEPAPEEENPDPEKVVDLVAEKKTRKRKKG